MLSFQTTAFETNGKDRIYLELAHCSSKTYWPSSTLVALVPRAYSLLLWRRRLQTGLPATCISWLGLVGQWQTPFLFEQTPQKLMHVGPFLRRYRSNPKGRGTRTGYCSKGVKYFSTLRIISIVFTKTKQWTITCFIHWVLSKTIESFSNTW